MPCWRCTIGSPRWPGSTLSSRGWCTRASPTSPRTWTSSPRRSSFSTHDSPTVQPIRKHSCSPFPFIWFQWRSGSQCGSGSRESNQWADPAPNPDLKVTKSWIFCNESLLKVGNRSKNIGTFYYDLRRYKSLFEKIAGNADNEMWQFRDWERAVLWKSLWSVFRTLDILIRIRIRIRSLSWIHNSNKK